MKDSTYNFIGVVLFIGWCTYLLADQHVHISEQISQSCVVNSTTDKAL